MIKIVSIVRFNFPTECRQPEQGYAWLRLSVFLLNLSVSKLIWSTIDLQDYAPCFSLLYLLFSVYTYMYLFSIWSHLERLGHPLFLSFFLIFTADILWTVFRLLSFCIKLIMFFFPFLPYFKVKGKGIAHQQTILW